MSPKLKVSGVREIYGFEKKEHQKVAELYCEIWKEPPWNESFWTVKGVISDIKKEMAHPLAAMLIVMGMNGSLQGEYVGFTWGYEVSRDDLRKISGTNALDHIFANGAKVFYIDELGVRPSARDQGIGKRLSRALIQIARNRGCTRAVLRTDVEAKAARAVYAKIGFEEMDVHDAQHKERTYWLKKLKPRMEKPHSQCENCPYLEAYLHPPHCEPWESPPF